ncbi:MAG TPA: DUF3365 domain-containing protein [Armatimonadota bacterium]|nr:DUF3365 domain-containing protein [Armatimonadota bacterium]
MRSRTTAAALALALAATTSVAAARPSRPSARPRVSPSATKPAPAATTAPKMQPMPLDQARMTAAMLDDVYQITLTQIHRTYPTRSGQTVVAANVMRRLQGLLGEKGWPSSRFLGVNALLMNPDHRARDAFERRVVAEMKRGANRVEAVEKGQLRVATSVPLNGGCFSCHWSTDSRDTKAAITFSIPLK